MDTQGGHRIPIERSGIPGKAWLELRGSILLYYKETWVSSSSTYIPVEWIQIDRGRSVDLRRLWRGLLSLLVAILLFMPASLAFFGPFLVGGAGMAFAIGATVLAAAILIVGLVHLFSFAMPRPMIALTIDSVPFPLKVRFWLSAHHRSIQEDLLKRIGVLQNRLQATGDVPIRMNHMWLRPHPYRIALLKGASISLLFYLGLASLYAYRLLTEGAPVHPALLGLLAVPPLTYVAITAFRIRLQGFGQPQEFRKALRFQRQGKLSEAGACLEHLLEERPDFDLARLLLIRVLTEQCEFENALKNSEGLHAEHPFLATRLQANLWGLRRMHQRMQDDREE